MFLSDFPREILQKIADTLCLQDKISCSLVCKAWKNIFQNSMYSDISIESRKALDNILNLFKDNQPNYQENGYLVRYIRLHQVDTTDKDIYALQKTFPNIKCIHFYQSYKNQGDFGLATDWHPWRLLNELILFFEIVFTPDMDDKLVKLILSLPLLRRLDINGKPALIPSLSFSVNKLELIHSHLKHLGHLKLNSVLLTFSETDLAQITDVLPATAMRSLRICSGKTDYRWLFYFARKYPNIHTLDFFTEYKLPDIEDQRDYTATIFRNDPLPFQCLTKLNLRHLNCAEERAIIFWDIINYCNIPLKDVSIRINPIDVYSTDNLCNLPQRSAEIFLTNFSKTIEAFHLRCSTRHTTQIDLMNMKAIFYNLVKLNICSSVSVELDTFLSIAPRLKTLALEHADIKVGDELYTSKRFGLQSFKVHDAKITSDALRFLSFHCRDLKEMRLSKSSVYGNFTTPGCQFIDMTYTCLESFYISSTDFIIKDNKKCSDNMNITLITRPFENIPPKQEYDPNCLHVGIGASIKAHYCWFHTYKPQKMYTISKDKGFRIMQFISNYEENKRITLERDSKIETRKSSDRWNSRCVFGYTSMELGYVDDFVFERNIKSP